MLVIAGRHGQLCNRLFAFANVVAFAAENGLSVVNPGFEDYAGFFFGTAGDTLSRFPRRTRADSGIEAARERLAAAAASLGARLRLLPAVRLADDQFFDFEDPTQAPVVSRLVRAPLAVLDGLYLLDRSGFAKHRATIRRFFAPIPEIGERARASVAEARRGTDVLVGIHLRQGDYEAHYHGLLYYTTAEYVRCMTNVATLFAGRTVRFLICSNVRQDPSAFAPLPIVPGPGHPAADLHALAACDYIVGAHSTYSEWASFYGSVPRFVLNYKEDARLGRPTRSPALAEFRIHGSGYGRYASPLGHDARGGGSQCSA